MSIKVQYYHIFDQNCQNDFTVLDLISIREHNRIIRTPLFIILCYSFVYLFLLLFIVFIIVYYVYLLYIIFITVLVLVIV